MRPRRYTWAGRTPLALLLLLACSPPASRTDGTVVVFVQPGGAGAEAGLVPGDVLLSFERAAAPPANPRPVSASLSTCFAVAQADIEEAPRGPVTLSVLRQDRTLTVSLPPGSWGLAVRPRDPSSPARAACEAAVRGRKAYVENRLPEAVHEYREALAAARPLGDALGAAWILAHLGVAIESSGDPEGAEGILTEALELRRRAAPGSLSEATSWHSLGYFDLRRNPERARAALHRALSLRTRNAPQSLVRAQTLNVLGIHFFMQGDFVRAQKLYEQALAVVLVQRPGTDDESDARNNLGLVARERGDPGLAERYFEESAAILARIAPDSRGYANTLYNLGILAQDHGDYARADRLLRAALERHRKMAPESAEVATILVNLGMAAFDLEDRVGARQMLEHAVAIERRIAPGSLNEALALNVLARLASESNQLAEAERLARQALAIRQKQAPESRELAASFAQLGYIALRSGDLWQAKAWLDRALACRNLLPGSSFRGALLYQRGEIALQASDFVAAEDFLNESLAIRRRLSPQSYSEAETLWRLGGLYRGTGREAAAEETLERAAAAFEAQIGRLPDSDEVRAPAGEGFADLYRQLAALEVERGKPAEALATLERSRGRSLLTALAQRDLVLDAELPPVLRERQRQIDRRYEGIQDLLARQDPTADAGRVGELTTRLTELRRERNALTAEIHRQSPRYASLRYPQPLGADGIAASLEPGTVLLAYSTAPEETLLFVVSARSAGIGPRLRVHSLPIGRAELADQVAMFRSLLLRGKGSAAPAEAWVRQGKRLYERLISPAAGEIAGADRLLLSADGPLFHLPFAALVRPGKGVSFLIEEKPLHAVLSATLYAELQRLRKPRQPGPRAPVVVFADPYFATGAQQAGQPATVSPVRRFQHGLPALPGSRDEARAIASLFGPGTMVWTGRQATEARAKHLPRTVRYLHFATHALLDPRFPLDSALAFSTPTGRGDEDNGLLQAWEIFGLRIDADLVTLSACETGLGRDAGGEGLIGLTRAFQYAGARSIVASLWEVPDRSSAPLMERFYAELRAGTSKDQALQRAQVSLLRQPAGAFTHPYHWAAFGLIGDWR